MAAANFVALYLTTLGLKQHTFYLHTYIPALSVLLLIGTAVDDIYKLPQFKSQLRTAALAVTLIVCSVLSFTMIRKNVDAKISPGSPFERSFPVRRAIIAERVFDQIEQQKPDGPAPPLLTMVYNRPEGRTSEKWVAENVKTALGNGGGLKLLFDRLDMEVRFAVAGDPAPGAGEVFAYDGFGSGPADYTVAEKCVSCCFVVS